MKTPFADGVQTKTVVSADSSSLLSYQNGWGAAYASPASSGGKYVSRDDMNGFGNMATQNQFYFQAGGLNTFDQAFAHAVGGYPAGAVLDFLVGTTLYKVLSLKENNLVDFTGNLPGYSDIEQGGVDGVNWEYVNMDKPTTSMADLGSIGSMIPPDATTIIRAFIAPKSGTLFFDGTYSQAASGTGGVQWLGAGLFAKEWEGNDEAPVPEEGFNGWTPVYAFSYWRYGSPAVPVPTQAFEVQAGTKYLLASASGIAFAEGTSSLVNPVVFDLDMHAYII